MKKLLFWTIALLIPSILGGYGYYCHRLNNVAEIRARKAVIEAAIKVRPNVEYMSYNKINPIKEEV